MSKSNGGASTARTFVHAPAVRERTPVIIGLVGPSGSGKTYSALRLASGIARVSEGPIFCIDTESRRALHYAERFTFQHVPFGKPFDPLSYLAAVEHCVAHGAGTVIIDSMSHEHEGPGGVLEMHEAEMMRMSGGDAAKAERVKIGAWAKPKADRRRLINGLLQLGCNLVMCFRAKEKLKVVPGKPPVPRGWQPIAGEEFIYECTLNCLLLPGSNGVPTWRPEEPGEREMIKLPEQFKSIFQGDPQLTEDVGTRLAQWAAGGAAAQALPIGDLLSRYEACSDAATLRTLDASRGLAWAKASREDKARMKSAADAAAERVRQRASETAPDVDPETGEVEREPGADEQDG